MLEFFHFLHIIAAVVFAGTSVGFAWIIYPGLVGVEADARHAALLTIGKAATPVMAVSGILTLIGGIGRAWTSGVITSFGDLVSGYGLMVISALVVFIAWMAYDGQSRVRIWNAAEEKDSVAFRRATAQDRVVTTIAVLVLLLIMGAMRLGLY